MDGLSKEEKVEAWDSAWEVSLAGMAIVDQDFQFHRVNSQWLKTLGVPATEFYGKSFLDITPPEVRSINERQSRLVIEGKINSYLMRQSYLFSNGQERHITLLVTRVPVNVSERFLYFLCQILVMPQPPEARQSTAPLQSQMSVQGLFSFIFKYGKWIAGLGIFFGALVLKYIERFMP